MIIKELSNKEIYNIIINNIQDVYNNGIKSNNVVLNFVIDDNKLNIVIYFKKEKFIWNNLIFSIITKDNTQCIKICDSMKIRNFKLNNDFDFLEIKEKFIYFKNKYEQLKNIK